MKKIWLKGYIEFSKAAILELEMGTKRKVESRDGVNLVEKRKKKLSPNEENKLRKKWNQHFY